ncbi:MAG TPA: ABC transporter ATP-binding protein [Gemmatimonadaceae bacterium]|nr:ABC transporter ATP-binding protein [Gemmatimonadaceae bacterium]
MTAPALLAVRDLRTTYLRASGPARAVDGVSFDVASGETVALVGESGCGKTAIALSLMRLLPRHGRIEPGSQVAFDGRDLLGLDERAMRDLRGRRLAMIFQEPASALNPVMRVGEQVAEVARVHGERSRRAAWERAVAMLRRTGIADAPARARQYPHELSGGMRQRVLIAMALLLEPALVIADEPTSALDVTVQAQILDLLRELQRETGTAVLFITHDFGVVAELCSRALVMREGRLVEDAPVERLFAAPAHPYTAELLRAVPRLAERP